jgi:hypothetical protein
MGFQLNLYRHLFWVFNIHWSEEWCPWQSYQSSLDRQQLYLPGQCTCVTRSLPPVSQCTPYYTPFMGFPHIGLSYTISSHRDPQRLCPVSWPKSQVPSSQSLRSKSLDHGSNVPPPSSSWPWHHPPHWPMAIRQNSLLSPCTSLPTYA